MNPFPDEGIYLGVIIKNMHKDIATRCYFNSEDWSPTVKDLLNKLLYIHTLQTLKVML